MDNSRLMCGKVLQKLLESPQITVLSPNSSYNGGQLSTTMKDKSYYYKLHQYSFVGTFGRIIVLVNMEASRPMLVESNMQSTRTTTN
ncbi:hypothetical protein H5410_064061 [Solanum commersonii]|uniref:Uncharacterized protein n=1 Tax=Solanum commersonii TaxID=4109 RepID=A0A9J5W0K9_SOLCO|nr:hypothetical protein H5410_064061 [Solanum commersonii]